jgi:hypothetical protein
VLAKVTQADWQAGSWPLLERMPLNAAARIHDGFVDTDGTVVQRGPTAMISTNNTDGPIIGIWDGFMGAGRATVLITEKSFYLAGITSVGQVIDLTVTFGTLTAFGAQDSWTHVGGMLIRALPGVPGKVLVWGGTEQQADQFPGAGKNATFTMGSKVVSATGTPFSNAPLFQRGGLLIISRTVGGEVQTQIGIINQVLDASHIELTAAWPYDTTTANGGAPGEWYASSLATPQITGTGSWQVPATLTTAQGLVTAQIFDRLVVAQGNRVFPSDFLTDPLGNQFSTPFQFNALEEGFELPEGAVVTGMAPLRDMMIVFTTAGAWAILGLENPDPTDELGNPVQRLEQISRDVVLWAQAGVTSYRNALIVPATDDVYLFDGVGAPVPLTGGSRENYRSHVREGMVPGQATVYRGHYMLPMGMPDGTDQHLMIWRVDAPEVPYMEWHGHAGTTQALTVRVLDTARTPMLLGGAGLRLVDLTSTFAPDTSPFLDGDGSTRSLELETRTFTGPDTTVSPQWRKLRVRAETTVGSGSPVLSADYVTGDPGSAATGSLAAGQAGSFVVNRRSPKIRFTLKAGGTGMFSKLRVRELDVLFRASGRQ